MLPDNNARLINIIRDFHSKYDLQLIGASGDLCEFRIGTAPHDRDDLAEEVDEVCPGAVDQGTGSVEELAAEIRASKTLYFWWD